MKRILAFGDSFTAGYTKDGIVTPYIQIIADRLQIPLINVAERGNCNPHIGTRIQHSIDGVDSQIAYEKGDMVFVCWSGLSREFRFGVENGRPGHYICKKVKNNTENYIMSSLYIRATQNLLKANDIPYLMISAFITPPWIQTEKTENWIESTQSNNTLLDICTHNWLSPVKRKIPWDFNNKARPKRPGNKIKSNYLSDCSHPNGKGHRKIAETLYPYVAKATVYE